MPSIWEIAIQQFQEKKKFVLATILSVKGSSPRQVGAKALILNNGDVVGTIGGGLFESNVRDFAMSAFESGVSARLNFTFHGQDANSDQMICGGSVDVLVELIQPEATIKGQICKRLNSSIKKRVPAFLIKKVDLESGQTTENQIDWLFVDEMGGILGQSEGLDLCLKSIPPKRLLKPADSRGHRLRLLTELALYGKN